MVRSLGAAVIGAWLWSPTAGAQQPDGYDAPPSATFAPADQDVPPPPPPPPYANVPGANPPPAYGTPQAPPPAYGPAPAPYPPPPGPAAAPGPHAQPVSPPSPAYGYPAPQPPPGYAEPPANPQPNYAPPSYSQPSYAAEPVEASYAGTQADDAAFTFPDFSLRIDPLNWLLDGHLGFELEVEAFEWLTFETVPIFVTTNEPFAMPSNIKEYSNGWGPLAGASLNAGFWLGGNSFQGTVLRAGFTNYSYRYESTAKRGERGFGTGEPLDAVNSVQRRLTLMLGSGRRFGFLALAGGFGIEYDLLDHRRCIEYQGSQYIPVDNDCARGELMLLRRTSEPDAANLRGPFFPVELVFRFSIGVVFDD